MFRHSTFVLVFQEKGELEKIKSEYRPPPQKCPDYSGRPLGYNQAFAAFCVLVLGAVAGIIANL